MSAPQPGPLGSSMWPPLIVGGLVTSCCFQGTSSTSLKRVNNVVAYLEELAETILVERKQVWRKFKEVGLLSGGSSFTMMGQAADIASWTVAPPALLMTR